MLQVSPLRKTYCQKVDRDFLEKLNKQKPKTIEEIQRLWYNGDMNEVHHHYSSTRYRACNLHSFFANGNWEMRACNSTLHAGVIRSYVTLALAISNAALTKKFCSPHISESNNLRYSARVWLINLGLNGEEYKNCRKHLISHLEGNIACMKCLAVLQALPSCQAHSRRLSAYVKIRLSERGSLQYVVCGADEE